jgi:hypothetical protein
MRLYAVGYYHITIKNDILIFDFFLIFSIYIYIYIYIFYNKIKFFL